MDETETRRDFGTVSSLAQLNTYKMYAVKAYVRFLFHQNWFSKKIFETVSLRAIISSKNCFLVSSHFREEAETSQDHSHGLVHNKQCYFHMLGGNN